MEMRNRQITTAHLFEIPLCQLILIGLGKMIQLSDNLLLQLICYIIALHSSLHPTHNGTKAHTKHAAIQFYKPIFFASYYMNINFCCPKQGFQLTVAGLPPPQPCTVYSYLQDANLPYLCILLLLQFLSLPLLCSEISSVVHCSCLCYCLWH